MTPPPGPQAAPDPAPGWLVPGALVLRLMLVAALAVALSGAVAAWLVTRASGQEAMRRVVSQQTDEVEVVARLLASKIEQSQKVLRTLAAGITPAVLESPSSLEWLLQQGLPAVQFFDTMQVARDNGELRLNLRAGQIEKAADLDPAERDALRRTLVDGKPLVSELIAGRRGEARVMFTMPLHRDDGTVMGVVAGALRLQSQSLLPPSMTRSPLSSSSASSATVSRVGAPCGTITQTTRGASSLCTMSARDDASETALLRSYPTTSCPPPRSRSRMLKPILPSPTKPNCIEVAPFLTPSGGGRASARQPHRHQQVHVIRFDGRERSGLRP